MIIGTLIMPERIKRLPVAANGYPIPFFVAIVEGKPDFRVACELKRVRCRRENLCWVCGEPLTWWVGFVGGPLSIKNRHFSDGPMHLECAEFSLRVCPHILNSEAKRRNNNLPTRLKHPGGTDKRPDYYALHVCRLGKWEFPFNGHYWIWQPQAAKVVRWFHEGKEIQDPYAKQ
jgi:hypothetical protein